MLLTGAGQVFVTEVRQGLRLLAEAMENARIRPRRAAMNHLLAVSVLPSLAARWLVPRLSGFQSSRPGIDIAIHPTPVLAALDGRDGIDLAIRYGPGTWHGLDSMPLMKSVLFPVCSPGLLALTSIRSPNDILNATLLRNPRQKWRAWFLAAGFDVPEPAQGPVYDDAGLLLQAAATGQGIALARSALVIDDLATGRLVRLCDFEVEDDYGWFIVWREPLRCDRADFQAFTMWLFFPSRWPAGSLCRQQVQWQFALIAAIAFYLGRLNGDS
jgi:DNA-binding transcriptional LysR family regulator